MSGLFTAWCESMNPGSTLELDPVLEQAVNTARLALLDVVDASVVGEHLTVTCESHYSATHTFACLDPAYPGWVWQAVLARAPGEYSPVTVCETALVPGEDALVAPPWVPWSERIEPRDVTPRDVLPKRENDPHLENGFEQVKLAAGDDVDQIPNFELGLGRVRVLSPDGITAAAHRWAASDAGADGEFARRAAAHCSSCGYLMPMAGSVRTQFGVCASEWSPFDGRVVALDAGCGAHSETTVDGSGVNVSGSVVDDHAEHFDLLHHAASDADAGGAGNEADTSAASDPAGEAGNEADTSAASDPAGEGKEEVETTSAKDRNLP